MAEGYTSANQAAAQVINGELPAVAAENANYGAYQVDSAAGVDASFSLQDKATVHTLLSGSSAYLPEVAVAAAADIAWNRKGIQSAATQGILLGESIPKIANRMQGVGAQNRAQAVRWARTYTTAAENAGRIVSYSVRRRWESSSSRNGSPPSMGAPATATGNWTARGARSARGSATGAATPETPRPRTPRYATAAAPWWPLWTA